MSTTSTVIVIVASAWVGWSGIALLARLKFIVDNLREYGVPEAMWPWLGVAKLLGALGLLAGLAVPEIGVAAAIGLAVYFTGAVITVVRARYYSHVPFPLLYMAPAVVAGVLVAGG